MEQKKNKNGVIALLVVLVVILAVLCVLFATDTINFKTNKSNNNQSSETTVDKIDIDTVEDSTENMQSENEFVNIEIKYSGEVVNLQKYILEFDANNEYEGKLLNLTVSNIELNGNIHNYEIKNKPQDCLRLIDKNIYNDNHYSEYIDEIKIGHMGTQACYLCAISSLFVIQNKYLGVSTSCQGGIYISIFDEKGNSIDSINVNDFKFEDNKIIYDEYVGDDGCFISKYAYTIVDGKPTKELINKEKNTTCNVMNGKGCSCQ